jgi:hypothetical protein
MTWLVIAVSVGALLLAVYFRKASPNDVISPVDHLGIADL